MDVPVRRNHIIHLMKSNLSPCETISFTRQNHIFHKAKPYLSQGKTLSFTRWNLIFHKAKPYLSQGKTLSFARWNHIFHRAKPYLLQGETLSFIRRFVHIFHKKAHPTQHCFLWMSVGCAKSVSLERRPKPGQISISPLSFRCGYRCPSL